jgi:hypothetical protein
MIWIFIFGWKYNRYYIYGEEERFFEPGLQEPEAFATDQQQTFVQEGFLIYQWTQGKKVTA